MDKETRSAIERATQKARRILETDFAEQLEGTFEVLLNGVVAPQGGAHLSPRQHAVRERIVASVEHRRAAGEKPAEAVASYLRDAAFTALNRFAALEMIEARGLAQECVRKGEQSSGYREFIGLAPGVALLPGGDGYRLYLECLFDELSTEVKVLFDRRDPASALWPRRAAFEELLGVLNTPELASVWGEDETIGWVYQYFNSGDERRAMRDASQAPRNSRELAVRNQFFTPRYVVRFLTENTLARIWIEMMGGADGASRIADRCDFLVRDAESRGPRAKKDPRDLKLLDPACGSGHFLLYSFDLFLSIYEEAWADPTAAASATTGRKLRDDYPDLAALRRAAPALILEQNLHGVDIDPRCAQIAALALWLRAQRAWKEAGVPASERPRVARTHIVVAEPMPGDEALVDEFAATLNPPLLGTLFRKMVAEMRLAGELGTLLKVETLLVDEIRKASAEYNLQKKETGFLPGFEPPPTQGKLDFSHIDDDAFFDRAEELLLAELRKFAESAAGEVGVRRRLFAGDAAQGIALIELARTKFAVLLMNPPFGDCSVRAKKGFEKSYPQTRSDLYAAFVERGIDLLQECGMLGAITSRTGFFLSRFQMWREQILLKQAPPVVLADLGSGVLDSAMVEVAAYCLQKGRPSAGMKTAVLRLIEASEKASSLLAVVRRSEGDQGGRRFDVSARGFSEVPLSPFAYWVSDRVRGLFRDLPCVENQDRRLKVGVQTFDDFRFLRLAWEVPERQEKLVWLPFAKGGAHSRFYSDISLLIKFPRDGREVSAFKYQHRPREGLQNRAQDFYFHPGLTWPSRTQSGFSLRAMPAGCIFANKGPAAFLAGDDPDELLALLAVLNSQAFRALVSLQMAFGSYEVGVIQRTPIPDLVVADRDALSGRARRAWSLKRSLEASTETSHAFLIPALAIRHGDSLADRADAWCESAREVEAVLTELQVEIDDLCFDLYGIDQIDRVAMTEGFAGTKCEVAADEEVMRDDEAEGDDAESTKADSVSLVSDLVSWSVGVAFGRFDIRFITGEQSVPPEPEPFDALPVSMPVIVRGPAGLAVGVPPSGYVIRFPPDGVLVDDPGHARDLNSAVRAVFEVVFGDDADARWQEAVRTLDSRDHDLRTFLARAGFEQHLKRYSKSRRKAPIYWQLATPSASYSVWLYAHRLTPDTFFHVLHDVLAPKLGLEERKLLSLTQESGPNPTASQRKEIAGQETLVDELRAFRDEVTRVAPLWKPDLDDGVVLTMAPLWRLVPQHRAWQKELKAAWDSLFAGEYDWAHVAMHLWPERVVPKCATDRSLAIAHGLEEVFWEEDAKGKWTARKTPVTPVPTLVAERTSPAVKAALKDLLEAPVPGGAARATGRGKRRNG